MNQLFEIIQVMSGQNNSITIFVPYLEFFAGDKQAHALVETEQAQINATQKVHYRADGDALIARVFPPAMGSAQSRKGNGDVMEPILYTTQYTDPTLQIIKPVGHIPVLSKAVSGISGLGRANEVMVWMPWKSIWTQAVTQVNAGHSARNTL